MVWTKKEKPSLQGKEENDNISFQRRLIAVFVLIDIILFVFWIQAVYSYEQPSVALSYAELEELNGKSLSFDDLATYFTDLAEQKGGAYAYDVLKQAELPPNIDMHLLGHAVGDALYRQEGIGGMNICTHDFRNACSHSIVIGLFIEQGEDVLPEIAQACRQAPGGRGAYTICFHGFGHGVLAYTGYDLEKAVAICEKTGTPNYYYQESAQCISGTIMEMIGGGGYDRELWGEQRQKYLSEQDSLYPCNSSLIPDKAKPLCYTYLTPYLFEFVGADLGHPAAADFQKAFPLCGQFDPDDAANRYACFGGFGKEFVVLAQDRDIRKIDQMTTVQLAKVYDWCLLADKAEGIDACIGHAVQSLYWGGENDRDVAIRFCNVMDDPSYQESCYEELIGAVGYYIQDEEYREEFCQEISPLYLEDCAEKLR